LNLSLFFLNVILQHLSFRVVIYHEIINPFSLCWHIGWIGLCQLFSYLNVSDGNHRHIFMTLALVVGGSTVPIIIWVVSSLASIPKFNENVLVFIIESSVKNCGQFCFILNFIEFLSWVNSVRVNFFSNQRWIILGLPDPYNCTFRDILASVDSLSMQTTFPNLTFECIRHNLILFIILN